MICNVSNTERMARILVGMFIVGVGLAQPTWWGALGVIPVMTGLLGWCPAYLPFGISTNK